MKLDICHVKISFEMRYKSNMLKDISWKLKSSECSSVIAFENQSRIVILCGFQNIWSFLVFVTILIHSWLLFTLIACWLAISEQMPLKFIISFSWISSFSIQVIESSPKVYELEGHCDIRYSFSQGDMILCGLCQHLLYYS
jgi:hypothetical protein